MMMVMMLMRNPIGFLLFIGCLNVLYVLLLYIDSFMFHTGGDCFYDYDDEGYEDGYVAYYFFLIMIVLVILMVIMIILVMIMVMVTKMTMRNPIGFLVFTCICFMNVCVFLL